MPFNIQTVLNYFLIILALTSGLVAGAVASRLVSLSLGTSIYQPAPADAMTATAGQPQEQDLQIIVQRSLFDAASVGSSLEQIDLSPVTENGDTEAAPSRPATVDLDKYTLLGTVVGGDYSLALIQIGDEARIYAVGSEIEEGISLVAVERRLVVLLADDQRYELFLDEPEDSAPASAAAQASGRSAPRAAAGSAGAAAQGGVEELGDGRYRVDRAMVENARANMGTLLQSARMIPQLENGQTVGFRLVGMQRGSLLEQLGLRLGDVVMEINRIKLDSPEKALQIFQQVREANNISIGLIRNGQPQTFEYSLE